MENRSKINRIHSHFLLDEAWSPVARFRLLSNGVNNNTRLMESDRVAGDCACLACGNCVDACPVVRKNIGRVFIQNQRTSMALENIVQEECRRCYRCVNSCPQVNKTLKEYTLGYRRVEKIVHLIAALVIIALAATGVTYSHYGNVLGSFEGGLLKYGHRAIGVFAIVIPYLYYRFDVCHFRRTLKKIFSWGPQDVAWLRNTCAHIFRSQPDKKISRHEFNPAQKVWYLFILSFFPVLYLSGWSSMILAATGHEQALLGSKMTHMAFALSFDLMLFVHVYIKFIREWGKCIYQQFKNYQETGSFVYKG
jgi:cytochrome b subunit of formate dehydrogenase